MRSPNRGRCSIVVCVSRVLFSSSGSVLGNVVIGDGRCLSCVPTHLFVVAVAYFCSGLSQSPCTLFTLVDVRSSFRCPCSSSGGVLVARFGGIWSWRWKMLVVCARACLLLWLLRVGVFRNRRVICPCQWAPQVLWSIFDRRFGVSGAFLFFWWRFGKCGFRRTSCRIIAIICDRAVVCWRCRLLCSLFCDCTCAVPDPVISPHSSSLSVGL